MPKSIALLAARGGASASGPGTGLEGSARVDGRRARGERTRLRVLEALLQLVEEGVLKPTAQEVAARAGVALRTVYHHFEDVEALRRMALDLQMRRHQQYLTPVDPDAGLEERIRTVARQSRKLFEAVTPIRRAALFDELHSPEMAGGLRQARLMRRDFVNRAFAKELSERAAEGRALVDALDAATSWETWHYIRARLDRSAVAAEKTVALTLAALLSSGREADQR
jgi:AcrR family transcriptional regulator